jgi:hypothetical protein
MFLGRCLPCLNALTGNGLLSVAWGAAALVESLWHHHFPRARGPWPLIGFYTLALAAGVQVLVRIPSGEQVRARRAVGLLAMASDLVPHTQAVHP